MTDIKSSLLFLRYNPANFLIFLVFCQSAHSIIVFSKSFSIMWPLHTPRTNWQLEISMRQSLNWW